MVAALDEIVRKALDVVCIFPTGSGKSMLMVLPPLFEPASTTIIFSNFHVLTQNLQNLFHSKGIVATYWTSDLLAQSDCPRVVIAPIETINSENFRSFIQTLHGLGKLARFVMDEAHTVLTALTYRTVFRSLSLLRSATCTSQVPLVLLTATCPPAWTPALLKFCGCREDTLVFRESSDRPNLQFSLLTLSTVSRWDWQKDVVKTVKTLADQVLVTPRDKGIVYFPTISTATAVQNLMGNSSVTSAVHTSALSNSQRRELVQGWTQGSIKLLFCTSGFGQGVDDADVRLVVLTGAPWNTLDLVQQAGRAGRDGQTARVVMLPDYEPWIRRDRQPAENGTDLQDWLGLTGDLRADSADVFDPTKGCVRRQLAVQMDAPSEHVDCIARGQNVERCDFCQALTRSGEDAMDDETSYNGFYFSMDHNPGSSVSPEDLEPDIPMGTLEDSIALVRVDTSKFGSRKLVRHTMPTEWSSPTQQDNVYNAWIQGIKDCGTLPPCGFCYLSRTSRPLVSHPQGRLCPQLSHLPSECCLYCLQDGAHRHFDNGTCEMAPWIVDGPPGLKTFVAESRCNKCGEWRQDLGSCPLDDFVPQIIFGLFRRIDWVSKIAAAYDIPSSASQSLPGFREWLFSPCSLQSNALPNIVRVMLEFVIPQDWLEENGQDPLL